MSDLSKNNNGLYNKIHLDYPMKTSTSHTMYSNPYAITTTMRLQDL